MTEPDSTPFGRAITTTRQLRRLTQATVAEILGVERSYLSRVERGKSRPFQGEPLRRLARLLGAEEAELAALAGASRTSYRLLGVGVTDQHRTTGAALAARWRQLPAAPLAAMLELVTEARAVDPACEPTEFGRAIQRLRLDRGWSQHQVASAVGVARSHLSMVETGREPPFGATKIAALARLFGVKLSPLAPRAAGTQASYRLPCIGVSDLHRKLGSALESRWHELPAETLDIVGTLARQGQSTPDFNGAPERAHDAATSPIGIISTRSIDTEDKVSTFLPGAKTP